MLITCSQTLRANGGKLENVISRTQMNNNNNKIRNSQTTMDWLGRFSPTLRSLLHNLSNSGRGRKQLFGMFADALLVSVALWGAYSLRHGEFFVAFENNWYLFLVLPPLTVAVFSALGVYRWVIRSTNVRLFKQLFKGSIIAGLLLLVTMFLLPPDGWNPRSLILIFGLLVFLTTSSIRVVWKALFDDGSKGEPIAIYGAGVTGQQLANLLSADNRYCPVLFIDDDPKIVGTTLFGLQVIDGSASDVSDIVRQLDVGKVVLAMPNISPVQYHKKLQQIDKFGLPVQTLPSVTELMTGDAKVDDIRDVSISDILGRSEVAPDFEMMGRRIAGKTVLVTGGGGSIGSELCRQAMKLGPDRLVALDNCEANLYHLTEELGAKVESPYANRPTFSPVLGSVLDKTHVDRIIQQYDVDFIVHAAAYKHVPIVEAQPDQGVEVNIFGTKTVLDCAVENSVSDFVLISTDKAVRPTNAMGATKRVAELVLQAKAAEKSKTRISMVRFGNVLGSSGSVVPKFKKQILEGGPITLTHPDVTRYFMTIPEAAQLVLQAGAIAEGGEVFVLDMGEPVRIEELAITMVRLFGKRLKRETGRQKDIDIVVQGLRPGEKLYEELFISEASKQTVVPKISSAKELWLESEELEKHLVKLMRFSEKQDMKAIKAILMELAFLKEKEDSEAVVDSVTLKNVEEKKLNTVGKV